MLKHLNLFNIFFLYLYQNNCISNPNQTPSIFYFGHQITNNVQLGKTLQMSD